ncbi:amidohydrolase family protein [Streptomyces sp. NPDC056390]|uniref:metal-dependent hydrolase family protein n=1 Tax=Streptomyces sp. NPDC056390 TaxID=3345806 RepID=UPI0035D90BD6
MTSQPHGGRLILTGMVVIDGTGGPPVHDATVVVEGDRISSVVRGAAMPGDPKDKVVYVPGATVMPGLVDAHVHLLSNAGRSPQDVHLWNVVTPIEEQTLHAAANARKALASGVTTLRDTAGSWPEVSVRNAVADGVLDGPRILASGMVGMTAGHADMFAPAALRERLWQPADGVDECRKRVREYARMGVDLIKICTSGGTLSVGDKTEWRNYTDDEVHAIIDEAHGLGLSVAAHAHTTRGIRVALEAGIDTLEHGSGLNEELIELMLKAGTVLCPTLSISEQMLTHGQALGLPEESISKAEHLAPLRRAAVRRAYEAGVPIIAGTDSGNTLPFGTHARELQLLHELVGMTPMEAIVAGTSAAANALGIGAETGSVEPGKCADLLIVRGDPLADLTVLQDRRRLATVLRGGVPFDPNASALTQLSSHSGEFAC